MKSWNIRGKNILIYNCRTQTYGATNLRLCAECTPLCELQRSTLKIRLISEVSDMYFKVGVRENSSGIALTWDQYRVIRGIHLVDGTRSEIREKNG